MGKKRGSKSNNSNKKIEKRREQGISPLVEDERFAAAQSRPQFGFSASKKSANQSKIVLDERFSSVLTDPRFQLQEKDKYGRKATTKKNELDAFYTVEKGVQQSEPNHDRDDDDTSSSSSSDGQPEDPDPESRISYLTALSRGEIDVSSSEESDHTGASDDTTSDDDSSFEDPVHGTIGILDPSQRQVEPLEITQEESPFLAVTNLDWIHLRAVDIFAILSSFAPPGSLRRVQVLVSDFGKHKLEQELKHGPPSLWKKKKSKHEEFDEEESQTTNEDDPLNQDEYEAFIQNYKEQQIPTDSDIDPEKLRAYEASKLKYYFAVAEFENASAADVAYKEVDGMEFEHSSAAVDMRIIPKDAIQDILQNRQLRDQATSLPGNYLPPEFIVSALQQTNVQCTWEAGDTQRERVLTKYTSAQQWASLADNEDLNAYLASDASTTDQESDRDSDAPTEKGAKLRKLLGLDSDSDADPKSTASDDDGEASKEIRYLPGKAQLQEKIRTKLESAKEDAQELTPWEKYQQKRKEKRRERRQANRKHGDSGKEGSSRELAKPGKADDFFVEGSDGEDGDDQGKRKSSKEELELLMAGDDDEEVAKDFDMRGLQRIDKNKDKKLSKSRKRKEEKRAEEVSGTAFAIDLKDSRFAAVLDGDDGRFGIDKTDPQFKQTPAMREILDEQRQRRKKKRKTTPTSSSKAPVPPDVVEGSSMKSAGAAALSSLVMSLKSKVAAKS